MTHRLRSKKSVHDARSFRYFDYRKSIYHLLDGDLKVRDEFSVDHFSKPEHSGVRGVQLNDMSPGEIVSMMQDLQMRLLAQVQNSQKVAPSTDIQIDPESSIQQSLELTQTPKTPHLSDAGATQTQKTQKAPNPSTRRQSKFLLNSVT